MIKKPFSPLLALVFLAALALNGCSPYEEGPAISFRSKSERIANTWRVNYAVEADGDDKIEDWDEAVIIMDKDGGVTINDVFLGTPYTSTGTWELTNDDENLRIQTSYTAFGVTVTSDETSEILMLKEEEVWIKDVDDDGLELHLVPNS